MWQSYSAKDGVVLAVAVDRETHLAALLAAIEQPATVVPAARPLAQVAAHRTHVANLRRSDRGDRLGQSRIVTRNETRRSSNSASVVIAPMLRPSRGVRDAAIGSSSETRLTSIAASATPSFISAQEVGAARKGSYADEGLRLQ